MSSPNRSLEAEEGRHSGGQSLTERRDTDTSDALSTFWWFVTFGWLFTLFRRTNETNTNADNKKDHVILRLETTIRNLELEKQDALDRLSQFVSVKLRDNNPNIVDLNDQFRPTKLAEMFSELYDNEWTTVYTVMEDTLTAEDIISFLLDVVMESYNFCERKLEANWQLVSRWYLDEDLPGHQQTSKALKDGRKHNSVQLLPEIEKEYRDHLAALCDNTTLNQLLEHPEMLKYVILCVKLCFLMNATDPPVVLECPGWEPVCHRMDTTSERNRNTNIDTTEHITNDKREMHERDNIPQNAHVTKDEQMNGNDNSQIIMIDETTTLHGAKPIQNTKQPFDKERFKEYTQRGKYMDFVVWPAMRLCKNGALLGKGVAQGTSHTQSEEGTLTKWWK